MKTGKIFHESGQAQVLIIGAVLFFGFMLTGGVVSSRFFSLAPNPSFRTDNIMVTVPPKQVSSNGGSSGNGSGGNGSGGSDSSQGGSGGSQGGNGGSGSVNSGNGGSGGSGGTNAGGSGGTNSQSGGNGGSSDNGNGQNGNGTNNNLELKYFSFVSPTPTPTPAPTATPIPTQPPTQSCHDNGYQYSAACGPCDEYIVECKDRQCVSVSAPGSSNWPPITCNSGNGAPIYGGLGALNGDPNTWCGRPDLAPTDGTYCLGKPVIYLYPEKPTEVSVQITTPGIVSISIPPYPSSGWKNILAQPSGILKYQDNTYSELYYETSVTSLPKPTKGIVVSKNDLQTSLQLFVEKLGLKRNEASEFLSYWIPKLHAYDTPYYLLSVLPKDQKDTVDKVDITPKPDTFIQFIVYFKPLHQWEPVEPLILPSTPQRNGFTAIEWGGSIDYK